MAVTLHQELTGEEDSAIVSSKPSAFPGTADPTFVLDGFSTDANGFEETMTNWSKSSFVWSLPAIVCQGFESLQVHATLKLFMDHGAVVADESASVPASAFSSDSARIRDALVASGFFQGPWDWIHPDS